MTELLDVERLRDAVRAELDAELNENGSIDRGRLVQRVLRNKGAEIAAVKDQLVRQAINEMARNALHNTRRRARQEGQMALPGILARFDPPSLICLPPAEPGADYRWKRLQDATLGDIDLYIDHLQDSVKRDMVRVQGMQRMREALAPIMRGNWFMTVNEAVAEAEGESATEEEGLDVRAA